MHKLVKVAVIENVEQASTTTRARTARGVQHFSGCDLQLRAAAHAAVADALRRCASSTLEAARRQHA